MRALAARADRRPRLVAITTVLAALLLVAPSADAATWAITPTPNVTPFDNVLWGTDALSPTSAWAVGYADTGALPTRRPVVLRWSGTAWSTSPNPLPAGGGELRDVDATSTSSAWAVGFTDSSIGNDTLTERWNGTAWSIVPSPNVGAQNHLLGVKGFSATDAWAVGSHNVPGTLNFATLVERWNGSTWSIVPSPSPDPFENRLQDVDGVSSNDLWAVGTRQSSPDGVRNPLILHFNGSAWSSVATPPALDASLEGVVALSSSDVWAVGEKFSLSVFWHVPFALHWNGSSWTEVPMPNPSPQGGRLFGVSGTSGTNVFAVGSSGAGGPLILRWNGSAWVVEPVRSRATSSTLWDASAATTVFAVGSTAQLVNGVLGPSRTFAVRTGGGKG
jgi:hypothetical protein